MSQKQPKPVLTGQRIKGRKRDEKHLKYDAEKFRDEIVAGLNESKGNFEEVSKFLDQAGHRLEYERYGESLFDVLFTGGVLGNGGVINEDDNEPLCQYAIFQLETAEEIKEYVFVFEKLIMRRYKYLLKPFNEHVKKLMKFLVMFNEKQKRNLAMIIGFTLQASCSNSASSGMLSPLVLEVLFSDHLTKDKIALKFVTDIFKAWISSGTFEAMGNILRRSGLEARMLEFFPENHRNMENFENHFNSVGLEKLVVYYKQRLVSDAKQNLKLRLIESFSNHENASTISEYISAMMKETSTAENDMILILWPCLMNSFEWNKKPDLLQTQTLQQIKNNCKLLCLYTRSGRAQVNCLNEVQSFCYDNMDFMKMFQKIVTLLYQNDVVTEVAVLKWFKELHSPKGWSVFTKQIQPLIEWLENAEEESDKE